MLTRNIGLFGPGICRRPLDDIRAFGIINPPLGARDGAPRSPGLEISCDTAIPGRGLKGSSFTPRTLSSGACQFSSFTHHLELWYARTRTLAAGTHSRSHKPREQRSTSAGNGRLRAAFLRAAAELQRRLQCHWRRERSKETQAESGCNAFHRRMLHQGAMLIFVVRQLLNLRTKKRVSNMTLQNAFTI